MVAAHWGTFRKPFGWREVTGIAEKAMSDYGCTIWDNSADGDYLVIGNQGEMVVQAVCVPEGAQQTWVAITASSADGSQAEKARNDIRAKIVATVHFD